MKHRVRRKILLAVDGSDQALEAVRYAAAMISPVNTEIVLFYVGTGFPDVFWDMNGNPLYRSKKRKVMGWLADHQLLMGEFKEKAYKILHDRGFNQDDILVSTKAKKTGVLKDIIQETYRDYSALFVGSRGVSRLKDLVLGSISRKLAHQVKHIPTIVVGGRPDPSRILIALDESIESMRGVSCVAALAASAGTRVSLCHCLAVPTLFKADDRFLDVDSNDKAWLKYHENRFRPYMDEACQRLTAAGFGAGQIKCTVVPVKGSIIQKIMAIARKEGIGTIVVGRRDVTGFFEGHFKARFSDTIIASMVDRAVWVIS